MLRWGAGGAVRDGIIDDLCRNGRISLANWWENFTVSGLNASYRG